MGILIDTVRISGFRGLKNIQVHLDATTVLTGMNNTGKTTFLKAMQIAFGNSQFLTQDDFNIEEKHPKIIVDIRIVPVNEDNLRCPDFNEDWEVLLTVDRIVVDKDGNSYVPLRTIITYDQISASYKSKQYIMPEWPFFQDDKRNFWFSTENGREKGFHFDEIPFYYMDAQRDIIEDMKLRSSYIGRMLSKIEYTKEDIEEIEKQIRLLNDRAVSSSPILTDIKTTLKELDSAMASKSEGVEITPFAKKIRDLNKGITISYNDHKDSFPMEYHGMGTRSWSSLLTLKAFINLRCKMAEKESTTFFPILAIEEPEAHLHPNAQKKLFGQIATIKGQKIVSTHSPYIASSSSLNILRNFYKTPEFVGCGAIDTALLSDEDIRKIERQVINTRGELFFSKVIILIEGETEEEALPILSNCFFGNYPFEHGVDFIGVGGSGGYLPFLRIAEAFKIPWLIFSDGEQQTIKKLKKDLKLLYNRDVNVNEVQNVFILDSGCNFEKYLLDNGYIDEIKAALVTLHSEDYLQNQHHLKNGTPRGRSKTENICDKCLQYIYKDDIRNYDGEEGLIECLYDCMLSQKTQLGPVIADKIVESKKPLPPKVQALFEKVKTILESGVENE